MKENTQTRNLLHELATIENHPLANISQQHLGMAEKMPKDLQLVW